MLAGFHACRSSILVELEFGDVGFCGGRKTTEPAEKPSKQGESQRQTQTTCGNEPELHAVRGERRALSPPTGPSLHPKLSVRPIVGVGGGGGKGY